MRVLLDSCVSGEAAEALREAGYRAKDQGPAAARLLHTYAGQLADSVISSAEPWRVRIRTTQP